MRRRALQAFVGTLVLLGLLAAAIGCSQPAPVPTSAPASKPAPATTSAPASGAKYVMKVSSYGGAEYAPRIIIETWMALVKERSKGQIDFQYFSNSSLYDMQGAGDAITSGVIQVAATHNAFYEDKVGVLSLIPLCPMTVDWKKFNLNYRKSILPWYQEVGGPKLNWKYLWYPLNGLTSIVSRVPIKTAADFKGKLIRSTTGQKRALELIKASPVIISDGEVFDGLQKGSLDASTGSLASILSLKWTDVASYLNLLDIWPSAINGVMPLNYYNSLPADLRKIIDDAAIEADSQFTASVDRINDKALQSVKTNPKVQVITFTEDQRNELKKMIAPIHDEYLKKYPDFARYLDIIKKDNIAL